MLTILGLFSSALSAISKFMSWLTTRSEQKAGADAQSGRDNAAATTAETAIAQAEVDAPKTNSEIDAKLEDHSL